MTIHTHYSVYYSGRSKIGVEKLRPGGQGEQDGQKTGRKQGSMTLQHGPLRTGIGISALSKTVPFAVYFFGRHTHVQHRRSAGDT